MKKHRRQSQHPGKPRRPEGQSLLSDDEVEVLRNKLLAERKQIDQRIAVFESDPALGDGSFNPDK